MTDRERAFANLGYEYAEGMDHVNVVFLPSGREVRKIRGGWEVQPWNDNYWVAFDDLLDALRFAVRPSV